jgi:hypothetical protein
MRKQQHSFLFVMNNKMKEGKKEKKEASSDLSTHRSTYWLEGATAGGYGR